MTAFFERYFGARLKTMAAEEREALEKGFRTAGNYALLWKREYPCPTVLEKIDQHFELPSEIDDEDFDDEGFEIFNLRGDKPGLMFVGDVGSGKTFGMWRYILRNPEEYFTPGKPQRYDRLRCFSGLSFNRFLKDVSKNNSEALSDWKEMFENRVVVFIDDLPSVTFDKFFAQSFLELLEGLNSGRVSEVLINSQYDVNTLCRKWAKASPSSRDIVAGIRRRLKECFKGYLLKDEREKV